jgi:hypothetical protein
MTQQKRRAIAVEGQASNTADEPLVYFGENDEQVCLIVSKKDGFERFGFRRFAQSSLVVFKSVSGSHVLDFRYIEHGEIFYIRINFDPAATAELMTQFRCEGTLVNGTQVYAPKLTTDVLFIPVDKRRCQLNLN